MADPVDGALAEIVGRFPHARVVDVGGGSGTRAVPLARAGCQVVVVDSSTDALASLARRAGDAGVMDRIKAIQADADDLDEVLPHSEADVVLHHHLVELVEDPIGSLAAAARALRPGGVLSVLVTGALAAVVGDVCAGRYDAAIAALTAAPAGTRTYDMPALRRLIEQAGLRVESIRGIGVVPALVGGRARVADGPGLVAAEQALRDHPIFGQIAAELHAIAVREG